MKNSSLKLLENKIRQMVREELLKEQSFKGYTIKQIIDMVSDVIEGDSATGYGGYGSNSPKAQAAILKSEKSQKILKKIGLIDNDDQFTIDQYPELQEVWDYLEEQGF